MMVVCVQESSILINTLNCLYVSHRLISIMKEIGETDWYLQGLVCQVLWNYSDKIITSVSCFGEEETDDLITILNEYLGM